MSARRPNPVAVSRLAVGTALLAAAAALAACGSTASGSRGLAKASVSAAGGSGGCSRASEPAPRGPQHVPKPTERLSPAKRYVVTLATNCGAIAIQLDVADAPTTTASFAYLVKRGFYDDLTFHRVAAGFVIQGGDPNGDGSGGPGYTIVERPPANLHYTRGTVAMAKTATDPAGASGSQFFIVTANATELPPQYALVGKVVGSMASVDAIAKLPTVPPQDGEPIHPVVISRATLSAS
ncbi:MAG TPA: peptidylprolyl isomerase [Solirubrobacteraceae bacterium]|nr:peptidylprolyl isomerase [Solirubrobacteraceae bacterium]